MTRNPNETPRELAAKLRALNSRLHALCFLLKDAPIDAPTTLERAAVILESLLQPDPPGLVLSRGSDGLSVPEIAKDEERSSRRQVKRSDNEEAK